MKEKLMSKRIQKRTEINIIVNPPDLGQKLGATMSESKEFKSIQENSPITYLKPAELSDKQVEGIYEGSVEGTYGQNHRFQTKEGTIIVNGFGSLNAQMLKVNTGDLVRLVYQGMKKIKDGDFKGKNAHLVDVQRAV
jgi:hypothetical protein